MKALVGLRTLFKFREERRRRDRTSYVYPSQKPWQTAAQVTMTGGPHVTSMIAGEAGKAGSSFSVSVVGGGKRK